MPEHAELTAVACLMMLERVNYLFSVEVRLPRDEMVDRLSAIIYAAFHSAYLGRAASAASAGSGTRLPGAESVTCDSLPSSARP